MQFSPNGDSTEKSEKSILDGREMTCTDHMSDMFTHLHNFMNDKMLCDYEVVAGSERIKVHKVIMAACSDYFRAMVTVNMKGKHDDVITLDTVDAVGLKCVVDYAYTGKVNMHMDNVSSVVNAASYLQVVSLLDLCETFLISSIDRENCVDMLNLADLYDLTETCKECRDFIVISWSKIDKLQELSKRQFKLVICDDRLAVCGELDVSSAVMDWMETNKGVNWYEPHENINPDDDTWTTLTELLREVRWPLIPEDWLSWCDRDLLMVMKQIPGCCDLLSQAKDYHSNVYTQPLKQSKSTRVRCLAPSLVVTKRKRSDEFIGTVCNLQTTQYRSLECLVQHPKNNEYLFGPDNPKIVAVNDFIYACMGYDEVHKHLCRRFFRYDPRFDEWLELPPLSISHGTHFVLLNHNHKIYVIGGHLLHEIDPILQDLNEMIEMIKLCECFDMETNTWGLIPDFPDGISHHAGCVVNGRIFISGGFTIPQLCEVCMYDSITQTWQSRANMSHPRFCHVMENIDDIIFVIGGVTGSYARQAVIERYDTNTDQWTDVQYMYDYVLSHVLEGSYVDDGNIYFVTGRRDNDDSDVIHSVLRVFNEAHEDVVTITELPPTNDLRVTCALTRFPFFIWSEGRYQSYKCLTNPWCSNSRM